MARIGQGQRKHSNDRLNVPKTGLSIIITRNQSLSTKVPKENICVFLWVAAPQAKLLPIEYFHVVFTLPEALRALCQSNQRQIVNPLFERRFEKGQRPARESDRLWAWLLTPTRPI